MNFLKGCNSKRSIIMVIVPILKTSARVYSRSSWVSRYHLMQFASQSDIFFNVRIPPAHLTLINNILLIWRLNIYIFFFDRSLLHQRCTKMIEFQRIALRTLCELTISILLRSRGHHHV